MKLGKSKIGELLREVLNTECPGCGGAPVLSTFIASERYGAAQGQRWWRLRCEDCPMHYEIGDPDSLHLVCANWIEQCTGKRPEVETTEAPTVESCCDDPDVHSTIAYGGYTGHLCHNCGKGWRTHEEQPHCVNCGDIVHPDELNSTQICNDCYARSES